MLFLFVLLAATTQACQFLQSTSLLTPQIYISTLVESQLNKYNIKQCLQLLFQRGYYSTCNKIVEDNVYIANELNNAISARQMRLKSLAESLEMPVSYVQPILKWAQNHTHLFLSFKLSHRLDSPPCINVKNQNKTLINIKVGNGSIDSLLFDESGNSSFLYHSECIVSNQRIYFDLNLEFDHTVASVEIKRQGVGSYTIIVQKAEPNLWRWLEKSHTRWAVWQQIKTKYSDYMKTFFALIEAQQDEKVKKGRKKRKKIVLDDQPKTKQQPKPKTQSQVLTEKTEQKQQIIQTQRDKTVKQIGENDL